MLKSKLRYLMADKNINSISELIRDTKVSRETINKLYHSENMDTLKLQMLIKLCDYFSCNLSELIEYTPD